MVWVAKNLRGNLDTVSHDDAFIHLMVPPLAKDLIAFRN